MVGQWLVRMEDLDPPREVPGAADDILRTLEAFGLTWDGEVVYQSERHALYSEALDGLLAATDTPLGALHPKSLWRRRRWIGRIPRHVSRRIVTDGKTRVLGGSTCLKVRAELGRQNGREAIFPQTDVGDFTLLRADGHWAYHLAVVVDDADQGRDPRGSWCRFVDIHGGTHGLQQVLGFTRPEYVHVDVVKNEQGQKLSKQTRAQPVSNSRRASTCSQVHDSTWAWPWMWIRPTAMLMEKATGMDPETHLRTVSESDLRSVGHVSSASSLLGWNLVTWSFRKRLSRWV